MSQYQTQSWQTQLKGRRQLGGAASMSASKSSTAQVSGPRLYSRGQGVTTILIGLLSVVLIFSFARPPLGASAIYQAKFAIALILLFWLVFNAPLPTRKATGGRRVSAVALAFFAWMLAGAAGLLGATYPLSGLALLLTYAAFFLLTTQALPQYLRGLQTEAAERWITTICFASVVFAIAVVVLLGHGNALEYVGPPTRVRYEALFRHPNFVGYFSFLAVVLAIRLWLYSGRRLYLLAIIPAIFLTLQADSRGALGVMALFVLTLAGSAAGFRKLTFRRYAGLAIWAGLTLAIVAALLGFLTLPSADSLNGALSGRVESWEESIRATTAKDFWLGQGLGREDFGSIASDSYYVSSFVQTGFIGALCLASFVLTVLWTIRPKLADMRGRQAASEAFPFCLLAVLTVYSFSENVLFSLGSMLSLYVWIEAGIRLQREDGRARAAVAPRPVNLPTRLEVPANA